MPTLSIARPTRAAQWGRQPAEEVEPVELLELVDGVDGAGVLVLFESLLVELADELSPEVVLLDEPAESPEADEDEDEDDEPEPLRLSVL